MATGVVPSPVLGIKEQKGVLEDVTDLLLNFL